MMRYFIGTAGWSYKDWEGVVYPEIKAEDFHGLTYLARYIHIVEVNSTFYRPPSIHICLSWVRKVSGYPDFLFAVKLHQLFTHERKDFSPRDVDNFKFGIEPLRAKARLAAVLIQFPWSFANTTSHNDYLVHLFKLFAEYPLALEVRHGSWDQPGFYKLLQEHGVCFCNIDQPVLNNSIKPSAICTNPQFSYVRLHGRNYKNWFNANAGRDERYNYLYTKDELEEWVERIRDLGKKSDKVFIITNNHYRGQALANAFQIKNLLTGEKLEVPLSLLEHYPILKEIISKLKSGQLDLFGEK